MAQPGGTKARDADRVPEEDFGDRAGGAGGGRRGADGDGGDGGGRGGRERGPHGGHGGGGALGGPITEPPRKATAVGTAGPVGQAFAIVEENWTCKECSQKNFATRKRCFRCRAEKPANSTKVQWSEALEKVTAGKALEWKEVFDPTSQQMYYFNTVTGATQWARPDEMGPAPHATGWFGRGAAGVDLQAKYIARNAEWLKRPARVQVKDIDPKRLQRMEGANEYNIWYHRYIGENWTHNLGKDPADTRCNPETDAGWTQADKAKGERGYFCAYFARGACVKGKTCRFFHRIPTAEDDAKLDLMHDVFGRERHDGHRDDMNGVGAFTDDCRTLFVGGLKKIEGQDLKEMITRHFEVWGEIENVNVIHRLSIAFVRYRLRANAEFARISMENQKLDNDEILTLRWAMPDPNPVAKEAIKRSNRDAVIAIMQAKGISLQQSEFSYPADYSMPDAKRLRLQNGQVVNPSDQTSMYPDTDAQYSATGEASVTAAAAPRLDVVPHGVAGGAAMAVGAEVASITGLSSEGSRNYDYSAIAQAQYQQYWAAMNASLAAVGGAAAGMPVPVPVPVPAAAAPAAGGGLLPTPPQPPARS